MVHRVIISDNKWQRVVQRVTTSGNEWQRMVQRVTTSGTTNDIERQRVTSSDNEWQRVVISAFFWISEGTWPFTLKRTFQTLKRTYWIKSWSKPLRRNIYSKKKELRQFFGLRYVKLSNSMKIAWNKHNLIISSSVGSGHHDKYSYVIPYEYLSG